MIHLDTHVVIWLYQGDLNRLSNYAQQMIEENDIGIAPMVMLEIEYLYEIKRIKVNAQTIIDTLQATIGLTVISTDFAQVAQTALKMKWTRDSFDRLISATSKLHQAILLTKDNNILNHHTLAKWG
jgi:PIN domain nuclease of toxin-antitoxin system